MQRDYRLVFADFESCWLQPDEEDNAGADFQARPVFVAAVDLSGNLHLQVHVQWVSGLTIFNWRERLNAGILCFMLR